MRKLYLDVDGILLGKDPPGSPKVVLARHAREFLEFATAHFECSWLTTHCRGDVQPVLEYIRRYAGKDLDDLLDRILPSQFETLKTEALHGDFYWVDDCPLAVEVKWLRDRGLADRWICVDTRKRADDHLIAIKALREVLPEGCCGLP